MKKKEPKDEVLDLLEEALPFKEEAHEAVVIPPPVVPNVPPPLPMQNLSPSTEELFGRAIEQDDSVKSVAKQLFSSDVIDLKTEITHDEINNLTRLRFMQEKFKVGNSGNLDHVIGSFLRLRVSKDRKSRKEFIEALQTENRNSQGGNIWSKFFGGNSQP